MNGLQVAAGMVLLCMIAWLCFAFPKGKPIPERIYRAPLWTTVHAIRTWLPPGWRITVVGAYALVIWNRPEHSGPRPAYLVDVTLDADPEIIRVRAADGELLVMGFVEHVIIDSLIVAILRHANYKPLPEDGNLHHDDTH